MVHYVDAGTVMHVLLFVLHVCMLRECDGNASVGDRRGVVVVSAGHQYVGGTRGSGIVSNAADVLGMREAGVLYEMCMCLARGGIGGEGVQWMRGLGLGFTNPVGTGECWTCVCVAVVWVV